MPKVQVINISPWSCLFFQESQDEVISPEKAEEAKLKARYPNLGKKPGGPDLLRKRLQKGVSSPHVCLPNTQSSLNLFIHMFSETIVRFVCHAELVK